MIELESPAHDASPARTDQLLAALATQATIGNERETATAQALARVDARLEAMEKTIAPLVVDARGRAMFGARVFALLEKIKIQQALSIAILGATIATMGGLSLALVVLAFSQPAAVLAFVVALFNLAPG
jgi:hypothetical protein